MARYYKHTHTVTQPIPYEFRCERCQQDSGMLEAKFVAESIRTKMTRAPLKDAEKEKMHEEATNSLIKKVAKARQEADEKQSFDSAFKDKCPHCKKPQSWAVKGMGSLPGAYALVGAIIGGVIWFGAVALENDTLTPVQWVQIIAFCAIAGMLAGFARIGIKKAQTKSVEEKQTPQIYWPETAER